MNVTWTEGVGFEANIDVFFKLRGKSGEARYIPSANLAGFGVGDLDVPRSTGDGSELSQKKYIYIYIYIYH